MALLTPTLHEQPMRRALPSRFDSLLHSLLDWRRTFGFGRVESVVLALYSLILAYLIPRHEPWCDEAQAWLIARDSSFRELLLRRLHYEGAPPLWHILLRLFHLAHGPYKGVEWMGAAFAIAGIYVFLRWSPFPLLLRVLIPFTFFLQYQYAVIARSYNLFALLVFTLCALYGRREKLLWFVVAAGLLANLCLQGIVFATTLSAIYLFDLYRDHRSRGTAFPRGQVGAAVALYAAMAAVACYTALPAPDVNFAVTGTVATGKPHALLRKFIAETPKLHANPAEPDIVPPPPRDPPGPSWFVAPASRLAWEINFRDYTADGYPLPQSPVRGAIESLVGLASQATWPVSTSNILACVFLALTLLWLRARRSLRLLLPWAVLIGVGQALWVVDHHGGMLFIALIAGIWLCATRSRIAAPVRLERTFLAIFCLVLLLQIVWTGVTATKDVYGSYDPGPATAAYELQHPVPRTAAFHFWSVSTQPYYTQNPYFNLPHQYWLWSFNAMTDPYYRETVAQHPDRIIYSVEFPGDGMMRDQWVQLTHLPYDQDKRTLPWDVLVKYFHEHGYVETHRFCGDRFSRMRTSYTDCDLVLEPTASAANMRSSASSN